MTFSINTIWGGITFSSTKLDDLEEYLEIRAILDLPDSMPLDGAVLISDNILGKLSKENALKCKKFHHELLRPSWRDGEEWKLNAHGGAFFPITEKDWSNTVFYNTPEKYQNQESFESLRTYLINEGFLTVGGNFPMEKVHFPVLSNI